MVLAPPASCDSAVLPCFCGCLPFLHQHFPPQSPPSHPLNQSLHSQQQPLPWDCSTNPKLQLPAAAPSRGPAFLSRVYMAVAKTVILVPFRLPQINCSLSALNVSPVTQTIAPCGGWTPASVPPPTWAGPVLLTLLFFPLVPPSYQVLHSSIYSFLLVRYSYPLSAGVLQALLCLKMCS